MAKTNKRKCPSGTAVWRTAIYARLSREDGDKPDSDSIVNQVTLMEDYIASHTYLKLIETYADDGFTGTNFNRPDFNRMIDDILAERINCVLVKDLSRFGRDYIDVGRYLERWFPEHNVRFIAINDSIDSEQGPYDMLLPVKNVFNEQYARDISKKVRSSMQAKQRRGEFIGAFASYGYRKDPHDHNKLLLDPPAAEIVKRIFEMYDQGIGQIKIAKTLNAEHVPCPSEYKRLHGLKYHNGQKLSSTTYWTYATIHRMLSNEIYTGAMVQGKAPRRGMHGKAHQIDKSEWAVIENTHQAIIDPELWTRVQTMLKIRTRTLPFDQNVSPFAGFLKCADCGRPMCKTINVNGDWYYSCASYKRYGPTFCTKHSITYKELERVVLDDLNRIISSVHDLKELADAARPKDLDFDPVVERDKLNTALSRIYRLKKSSYEDYKDGLIDRADFIRYKEDYQRQEEQLNAQLKLLADRDENEEENPWIKALLKHGHITELDRATIAETIKEIRVFEDKHIEITYSFTDSLGLLEDP